MSMRLKRLLITCSRTNSLCLSCWLRDCTLYRWVVINECIASDRHYFCMFALLSDDRRQDLITVLTCTTKHTHFSALTSDTVFSVS